MLLVLLLKLKKDKIFSIMNFLNIVIIVLVICIYCVYTLVIRKMTVKRKVVFAGHPLSCETTNVDISPLPQNDPKYIMGTEVVNVAGLEQMVVKGHSLEPFGIKDNAIVFVKENTLSDFDSLKRLVGRYIVFKIDNERTLQEYPLRNIAVAEGGLKLRKVVKILSKNEDGIEEQIKQFLVDNDKDYIKKSVDEQQEEYNRYIKKLKFALSYYDKDDFLIMSITYKNGVCKDYSFHSPKWLYGIVEYNTK